MTALLPEEFAQVSEGLTWLPGNPPQALTHTAQLLVRFCDVGSRRRRGGQSVQGTFQLLLVNHTNAAAVHVDLLAHK